MVPTAEDCDKYERASVLLARDEDEAEDALRNELLSFWGEKREVIEWNREDCILTVGEADVG